MPAELILVRRRAAEALGELRRGLLDLGEADHGDDVVLAHRAAVDLLQEVLDLVMAGSLLEGEPVS